MSPVPGPASARLTHLALPVRDLDATVAWYRDWTPLEVVHHRADADGRTAWLGHTDAVTHPFVLVFVEPAGEDGEVGATLAPFAHLGIELPSRRAVDAVAVRARDAGILHWDVVDHGPPVGYVCAVLDPDGNVVEFSFDQGVYAAVAAAE